MDYLAFNIAPTSVKIRVKLHNSATDDGKTGLTFASSGLIISTIQNGLGANGESAPVNYTAAAGTIESITTLGTYAAPTASKCRFKEIDATYQPGVYEIQFDDARFSLTGDATKPMTLAVHVFGPSQTEEHYSVYECRTAASDVVSISGDVTAADNFETMLDGTGGNKLTLSQLKIVATGDDSAIDATGSGSGAGMRNEGGATGEGQLNIGGTSSGHGLNNQAPHGNGQYNAGAGYGVLNTGIVGARNSGSNGPAVENQGTTFGTRNTASAGPGQSNEGGTNSEGMKNTGAGVGAGQMNTGGATGHGVENAGVIGQRNYSPTGIAQHNDGVTVGQQNSATAVAGSGQKNTASAGGSFGQFNTGVTHGVKNLASNGWGAHNIGNLGGQWNYGSVGPGLTNEASFNGEGQLNKGAGGGAGMKNLGNGTGQGQLNIGAGNSEGMRNVGAGTGKDISAPINDLGLNNGTALTAQQVRDAMALGTAAGAAAGSVDKHLDDLLVDSTAIKTATTSPMAEITVVPGANPTPTQALMLMYQKDSSKIKFHRDSDATGSETIYTSNDVARMKRNFTDDGTDNIFTKLENI